MDKGKKRLIVGGVVAGGGMLVAAGLILGAGLAKADVYGHEGDHDAFSFVAEMHGDGVYVTLQDAVTYASTVCSDSEMGYTRDQMITGTAASHGSTFAIDVVMGAAFHFCPQYDSLHTNDYGGPAGGPSVPPSFGGPATPPPMTLAGVSYQDKRGGHGKH